MPHEEFEEMVERLKKERKLIDSREVTSIIKA